MAKRIRISDDNGVTWYTFPGSGGSISSEAGTIPDTVLGQIFASTQTGLIGYSLQSNGLYKGFAGYVAKLLKSGATTAMTAEAMTLVSGKTYKITNAVKSVWNRAVTPTFTGNAIAISAANIESIDFLHGRVTFAASYTPVLPIVLATGSYLPMATIGKANTFSLTQTLNAIQNTDFDTAQANSGHRTFEGGLKTVSLELGGIYASSNAWRTALIARSELVIEINPDGSSKSIARGFFKPTAEGQSGDVGDLEEQTATFSLSVPDQDSVLVPFSWVHASDTTLNTAIRKAISAWEAGTAVDISYLPDGTTGFTGDALITDLSLSGGLETMNDFTINAQYTGALTAFP